MLGLCCWGAASPLDHIVHPRAPSPQTHAPTWFEKPRTSLFSAFWHLSNISSSQDWRSLALRGQSAWHGELLSQNRAEKDPCGVAGSVPQRQVIPFSRHTLLSVLFWPQECWDSRCTSLCPCFHPCSWAGLCSDCSTHELSSWFGQCF